MSPVEEERVLVDISLLKAKGYSKRIFGQNSVFKVPKK